MKPSGAKHDRRWPSAVLSVPNQNEIPGLTKGVRAVVGLNPDSACSISLRRVCEVGGFRVLRSTKPILRDAFLVPRGGTGFDVIVRQGLGASRDVERRRLRFALAHEIGHSFFFDRTYNPHIRASAWTQEEETFCNEFARALLVPAPFVRALPVQLSSIRAVRERFDVSLQVAANAFASTFPDVSVVALMELDHAIKGRALRIAWSAGSRFIPTNARLGSTIAERAWDRGAAWGIEDLSLGHLRGRMVIEAQRETSSRQVIVFLRPQTPLEAAQLELFDDVRAEPPPAMPAAAALT